ncbi:MAG: hypothetical protein ACK5QW_06785 [Cyanobacteriota bacterium]
MAGSSIPWPPAGAPASGGRIGCVPIVHRADLVMEEERVRPAQVRHGLGVSCACSMEGGKRRGARAHP